MNTLKYYWVAFSLKEEKYSFQDQGESQKTDLEINALALKLAQGKYTDNPLVNLPQLIEHWNSSQSKEAKVLWFYSQVPVDEIRAREALLTLGYLI